MKNENTIRIILKRCQTGGHGELLSEEYNTVDITSEEIEKLILGSNFIKPFSVVGAELIDPEASKNKHRNNDVDW